MEVPPPPEQLRLIAAALRSAGNGELSERDIRLGFATLTQGYVPLEITRSAHQIWYRSRICDDVGGWSNVRDLLYPPNGSPLYGRASLPGAKVLYAGWNVRVSFDEIGALPGQYVQSISLRPRSPIEYPCTVLGEHQAIYNSGRSVINSEILETEFSRRLTANLGRTLAHVFVDSVLSELFRARVEKPTAYMATAVIADEIMQRGAGLIYPSVQTTHAINLAVRADDFDSKFEVLGSGVCKVIANHGYGLYALEQIKETWEIDEHGAFVWASRRKPTITTGLRRDFRIPPEFTGWRVR